MQEQQAQQLLKKYLAGGCTDKEKAMLETWYIRTKGLELPEIPEEQSEKAMAEVWARLPIPQNRRVRPLWQRLTAAAAVALMILGAGLIYYQYTRSPLKSAQQTAYKNDIAPGKQGATLTLASGKKIKLTDATNGELAKETGVSISKTADGQVVYTVTGEENVDPATSGENVHKIRNVLSTDKGETYMVVLPDQTKVWLNAASSLIYNTNMNISKERVVTLQGEAYFQVAKDKAHPFLVISGIQEVEVLGTHFNINAYQDEPDIKTTLLEGSVKVTSGNARKILKPDQQSAAANNNISVENVDAQDAVGWKNKTFIFNNENLESVMRQLSRWYSVEIKYKNAALKTQNVFGSIGRYNNVSKVLDLLEKAGGLKFQIEDNTITVDKN